MRFDPDNIKETKFVDERYDYTDFPITDENFQDGCLYECDYGHTGAKPMLLKDSSMYDPRDGRFKIEGVVVYACRVCEQPVSDSDY